MKLNGCVHGMQILNGGAPCQQIDSEEEDEQEAEAEDDVSTRDTLHALSRHVALLLLCCAVLCCAVLCCAVLCCAMLCPAVWSYHLPMVGWSFCFTALLSEPSLLYMTLHLFCLGR